MEAPVETVNKRTEVTGSVFGEIECMISATQAGFEVAQNRIDPVEFWQILSPSSEQFPKKPQKFSIFPLI